MKAMFVVLSLVMFLGIPKAHSEEGMASGKIQGVIKEKSGKVPVEFANVILLNAKDSSIVTGTTSNQTGYFELTKVAKGKYLVKVQFIGYRNLFSSEIIIDNENKLADIGELYLEISSSQLSEVEVASEKTQVEFKMDKRVINVDKNLMSAQGSAADILQSTSTVQTDINGNISIRGSSNFIVQIDGRPSVLQGSDALRQIPASSIENIEVITNPSAKYDPDGTSGIINIITKKEKAEGLNALINTNVGTKDRASANGYFNYRFGKLNLFANLDYSNMNQPTTDVISRIININDTLYRYNSSSDQEFKRKSRTFNIGADYNLSDKTTLGLNLTGGRFLLFRNMDSRVYNFTMPYTTEFYKASKDNMDFDLAYYSGSMNYNHKFKKEGDNVSAELMYAYTDGSVIQKFSEYFTNNLYEQSDNSPARLTTDNSNHRREIRIKEDFVKTINEQSKFEAGVQTFLYRKTVDFAYNNFIGDAWVLNNDYSNSIDFTRDIYNVYAIFSSKIKGFEYQLGVRGEYEKRMLSQKTMQVKYSFEDLQIYPTVHVSRQFPKEHQLMASYSRRVSRPQDYWLNPFPDYTDSYYISKGNPLLKPEFTDSYELNYQKQFKKAAVSFSAYYRLTHDLMQRTETLMDNRMILLTFANLDNDEALGFELSPSFEIGKWLKLNPVFNAYKYSINGMVASSDVSNSVFTWNAQLMAVFQIGASTKIQLSGNYNAKSLDTQGDLKPLYMANVSLKQEFFKRKLVVSFQAMNIFKTGQYCITTKGPGFSSDITMTPDAPVFSVGISYRINNFRKAVRQTEQPALEQ